MAVRILVVLVSFFLCNSLWAERIEDLYRYSVLMPSQNNSEARQATVDGLAEVILRTAGDAAVLQDPAVIRALGSANNFVVSQGYQASDETLVIEDQEVPALKLVIEFSGERVQSLLRESQLSLWPDNRRNVLTWIVVDDTEGRRVISDLNFPEAQKVLTDTAKRRGLPLVPKLMDLEDQIALSANQLWSMSVDAIRSASERYDPDTILAGRLSQTSRGDWRSVWQLMNREGEQIFDGQGASIEDVIAGGINAVVDYFCERECIRPNQSGMPSVLIFQLGGINNFSQYSQALNYIEELALVRRVDIGAVQDNNLLLYLYSDGDVRQLQDTLSRDGRMNAQTNLNNPSPLGTAENPLLYIWRS